MPKREDIKKILIIGSGPIVIGQACEFDYSGTQACKALKQEGYEIILVNSNPATIMTDPKTADRTYIEPITVEVIEKILDIEKPDAILPTLGGQTGLNTAIKAADAGILKKYGVEMIGANYDAIRKAEDRSLFKEAMVKIGLNVPQSGLAYNMKQARQVAEQIGFPLIIRPSYTLGGTGGSTAYNMEEFDKLADTGLKSSMISEILIEESVLGWKEYELEVMRDKKDNVVIICSIENIDAMGVHTGDSVTVAPAQTLTDKEYQMLRDASIKIMREIGVETGGSNVQFALNPMNGKLVVIEMNPRVSRSSALASKATGFPIAKIAAKLAVGYTLDEIPNDITQQTPACFEPTIDYCVIKIPRFAFEKFPQADSTLTISMKSVGETMAIGRTFKEAFQKGLRSLEIGRYGLESITSETDLDKIREKLSIPNQNRLFYIKTALQNKMTIEHISKITKIDKWFIKNIEEIVDLEKEIIKKGTIKNWDKEFLTKVKQFGFSDKQIACLTNDSEDNVRNIRKKAGVEAVYKLVDTCGAEFEAYTPYYYSTYEEEDESRWTNKKKIMILGGGPNRIGQGIEFDYCCVHAAFALKEDGFETIMVNSNPETVSTDYDTSDKLYFEPLTKEDVLNIADKEKPDGVIVQFGGQTPLNLAKQLEQAGLNIIGTKAKDIDRAEDRDKFQELIKKLKLLQPANGIANSFNQAKQVALKIGFPVVVRPSYVLGGRAMMIVYDIDGLNEFMKEAVTVSPGHPILIDKFLEDAIEIDVDAVSDGKITVIAGIMEHIEEAGIHSGDSACALPPYTLDNNLIKEIKQNTYALAKELNVIGLINIQYAVKDDKVYILEVNPRASRTVPFVSKASGVPWAKIASRVMAGKNLEELGINKEIEMDYFSVKEAVLPFNKFSGVDPILGPEMKSTGEVMGIDENFGNAFAKSQISAYQALPLKGRVFISVKNKDKRAIIFIAKKLIDIGFELFATYGTAKVLKNNGLKVEKLLKVYEGRPNVIDLIKNKNIDLIINTPGGNNPKKDDISIRSIAIMRSIPCITTIAGAQAAVNGIESMINKGIKVKAIQDYYTVPVEQT